MINPNKNIDSLKYGSARYIPAMISGLALTLCFPRTNFSYLAFFALIPWLVSLRSMTSRQSFYSGFVAGLAHFLTLIYWIVPTLHEYGGLHPILAVSTLVLLCMYLSVYPALFAFLLKRLDTNGRAAPLLAACLWVGLEYIRTYAFTGFSWGALGYSQSENLLLIQIADLSGIYGVSFLIVLINCVLASLMVNGGVKQNQILPLLYTALLLAGVLFYGAQTIETIDSQLKDAPKTRIMVVQGNIEQDLKWSEQFKQRTLEKYIRLSQEGFNGAAPLEKPDLVIWPETALPFYYGFDTNLSHQVDQCIRSLKTSFLIGSPAFNREENKTRFYNRAFMLNRFSLVTGTYDKNHLVPFGEYVPFGRYLAFLGKLTAQAGDFSTGDGRFEPLAFNAYTLPVTSTLPATNNLKVINNLKVTSKTGVLICFEILFPAIAARFVENGAGILTTITNDAWFGHTSAPAQHFAIAVFRAVETRRTVARAANTGISGFIDPTGKILETTPLFTDQALVRQVPALNQITFYTRYGDVFAIASLVAIGMMFMVKGTRKTFCKTVEEKSK